MVRALAAGGPTNANGSQVIYATTDGLGPNNLSAPIGGNVWVTTNATAVSGTVSTFTNVTLNGPGGSSINPNQFPISSVAIDSSDPTGNTAYVTVMGFTGRRPRTRMADHECRDELERFHRHRIECSSGFSGERCGR